MSGLVVAVVVFAALLHAGWNAIVKAGRDIFLATVLVSGGVLGMTLASRINGNNSGRATALALLNACVIAGHTLIDGVGVRLSGAPAAYTMWIFVLNGAGLLLWTLTRRRHELMHYASMHWRVAPVGGLGTLASYGLALWAMTRAPVAAVAALRETSIVFASLIALAVLCEKISSGRWLAIALIAAGRC